MDPKAGIMVAQLLAVVLLMYCKFSESSLATDFVGIGYDLLRGNPNGNISIGGIDPGFRLARYIFSRTYNKKQTGYYNGIRYKIPDSMTYQSVTSCSSKQTYGVFDGTKSYQKRLSVGVSVDAEADYGLVEFSFSASAGYAKVRNTIQSDQKVEMDLGGTCKKAHVKMFLSTAKREVFSVSDDFLYSVKELPTLYNEDKYLKFIKNWGTHFVEEVTVGAKLVERYRSSYGATYEYAAENIDSSVSAGGSYGGFIGSFKVDINKFSARAASSSTFGSHTSTVSSGPPMQEDDHGTYTIVAGDKTSPIPIEFKLKSITEAFDRAYWKHLKDGIGTYNSIQVGAKLRNIERVLRRYPNLLNVEKSSDPEIQVPNAWPDGLYSLPKPGDGCPPSGDGFEWREGSIRQTNEGAGYINKCPSLFFSSLCLRHILQMDYCTKTIKSRDYGIAWPKGSYCIGKKDECPSGFYEAYVFWDDLDGDDNRNKMEGTVPDGVYNHNTKIFYCCRKDRHPHHEIVLPVYKPLILIRNHEDGCQEVRGATVESVEVVTDDEDKNSASSASGVYGAGLGRDQWIFYCFYLPNHIPPWLLKRSHRELH